jgi:hypothetical protein
MPPINVTPFRVIPMGAAQSEPTGESVEHRQVDPALVQLFEDWLAHARAGRITGAAVVVIPSGGSCSVSNWAGDGMTVHDLMAMTAGLHARAQYAHLRSIGEVDWPG